MASLDTRLLDVERELHAVDVDTNTRLHALEARVAALEEMTSNLVTSLKVHIEQNDALEARVAALEADCKWLRGCAEHQGDRLADLWNARAGGPEPAAVDVRPAARQEDNRQQRDSRPAPAQAAQPAPQQPRFCHACAHRDVRGSQPPCRTCMIEPARPAWQPRSGGGAL